MKTLWQTNKLKMVIKLIKLRMQIEKESTLNVYMYVQKGGGRKIGDKMCTY